MPCYTQQPKAYGGIDLHARPMDVCILTHARELMVPQQFQASPETCLKGMAPYRADVGVAVACLCTWDWLAALWAREGMAFVRGPARSMTAMPGGKAQNAKIEAQPIAGLLRGGMRPQASVSPAAMRATRELLRRRMLCRRQRAALLTPVQHPNRQDNRPEIGRKIASKAHRVGVAARCPEPAVQKSSAVALALLGHDDPLRRDVAWSLLRTAKQHYAHTR